MKHVLVGLFVWTCCTAMAQLPVVRAQGGDGRTVNWAEIKKQEESQPGPGFFYFDCELGVTPTRASSTLPSQGSKSYGIKNLFDGNPMSAWVEGDSEYGIGEYFEVDGFNVNVIYNGYQSSPSNWLNNSRVKRFLITKNGAPLCYLDLTDEMGAQYFTLPVGTTSEMSRFRFVVIDVYKGTKWKDVAISEVSSRGCCISDAQIQMTNGTSVPLELIQVGMEINSIDMDHLKEKTTSVKKMVSVIHSGVVQMEAGGNQIVCTMDHPFFFEGQGKSTLAKLMNSSRASSIDQLVENIKILVWNFTLKEAQFVPIESLIILDGRYKTYSILELNTGDTYIANGFVSATY